MRKLALLAFIALIPRLIYAQNTDDQGNPLYGANFFRFAGVAPSATNPVPGRLSDGTAFYVAAPGYAQGSTTSGQLGGLLLCAVSTSDPSYTNGQSSPFSCTTAGGLRVSGTMTISGTPAFNLAQLNAVALASPFDADSGAGTQSLIGISLRKIASGGSVEAGTATDPFRTDPVGTTAQPITAASLPLPTGASTLAEQQTQTTSLQKIDNIAHAGSDVPLVEHVPMSAQLDDISTTTVTENQVAPLRMTPTRDLRATLRDPAGNELGTAAGPLVAEVEQDALSQGGTFDGDEDTVTIGLSNKLGQSPSFKLASGTLAATILPECSIDGTNFSTGFFYNPTTTATTTSLVVTNPNPLTMLAVICPQGTWSARARVDLFTSGSATVSMLATGVAPTFTFAQLRNSSGAEISAGDGKILDGTAADQADVEAATLASATLEGVITRPYMPGDGTLTATLRDTGTSDAQNVAIVDASGNQITSFGGGTQYAEDTASADAEQLTMAGVVRQDTPAGTTSLDGDRTELKSDSVGRLWVNGSGVTQPVSGTVTADAGTGTFIIGDGAGALNTIVDSGSLTCNAGTNLNTSTLALDATLTGRLPAGSTPADNESNAVTITRIGSFLWCFDGTTWDRCPGNSADGLLVNLGTNNDVTVTSGTVSCNAGTNLNTSALALDATLTGRLPAGSTPADNESNTVTITRIGSFLWCFDGTTWDRCPGTAADGLLVNLGANNDVTIQSNAAVNQAQVGGSAVVADPCMREARIPISISQTAGTQLITGTASERIFICSIHVVTATAQNIALVSGTGTVCATSTSGVVGFGGATAATGWNFAANGGIQMGHSNWSYGKTDTDADNVCLLNSGSGQISGGLTYVSAANF